MPSRMKRMKRMMKMTRILSMMMKTRVMYSKVSPMRTAVVVASMTRVILTSAARNKKKTMTVTMTMTKRTQ